MKNIGLVGFGFIGKTHLEAYQKIDNCRVKAIYTKKGEGPYHFAATYEDLLNDQEIDIIDICLPTYLHEEYIIKAANAGKHIICEKPLVLKLDSATRIIDAVKKNNVELFVGHILRFWPEYQVIKSYSETEKLADIEIVHAKRLGQVPKWSTWFQHPELSGGALFDLHIHDIDFVTYLLGEVRSVYAVGSKNQYCAWDHVMTTLIFKNGGKAFVEASQRMPMGYPFTMSLRAQTAQTALDFSIGAGENIENINDSQNQFIYYSNQETSRVAVDQGMPFTMNFPTL
jgi:predicted dehydrogenase